MKRYNAEAARQRAEPTIGELYITGQGRGDGSVLKMLNGFDRYGNRAERTRLLDRTATGKHYRMGPVLAEVLNVDVVNPPGDHGTVPPTVLVPIASVVESIARLSAERLSAEQIVDSIHKAIETKQ